jgi:hypothetical protein
MTVVALVVSGAACSSGSGFQRGPAPTEPVTTALTSPPGKTALQAHLSGRSVVPGPGAASGTGTATITLDRAANQVCYKLTVASIDPALAAAIFTGPAGAIGPSMIGLDPPESGKSDGCVPVEEGIVESIASHPNGFYISISNVQFPGGALRGQLST